MEVDESFCYNNVPPHFAHVEGSSVDQRVPEHWFELSCLLGRKDPLTLESLRGGALIFEWRRPVTLNRVDSIWASWPGPRFFVCYVLHLDQSDLWTVNMFTKQLTNIKETWLTFCQLVSFISWLANAPPPLRLAHIDVNVKSVLGQDWTSKNWSVGSTSALWPLKIWHKFRTMTITPGYRLVRDPK